MPVLRCRCRDDAHLAVSDENVEATGHGIQKGAIIDISQSRVTSRLDIVAGYVVAEFLSDAGI